MKLPAPALSFAAAALAAAALSAAGAPEEIVDLSPHSLAAQAGQVMGNVRLTLKRHPGNGRVKELLKADKATVDDAGIVHVEGTIRLIEFNEDGTTNSIAAGRDGFFDPSRNYAECHGPVAFIKPGIILTGTNLTWNSAINLLRIETNAILRIDRGGRSAVDALAH